MRKPEGRAARRRLLAVGVALAVLAPACLLAAAPAGATTFSNSASIALNDPNSQSANQAKATPYPSTISVSGLTGTISNVTLTLTGVTYKYSADIDVLLVGPGGQSLIPLAAVGPNTGTNIGANDATITLSDAGTTPTDTTAWGSSPTFHPVNYGNVTNGFNEVFASPAPAGPYGNPGPDPGPNGEAGGATFASQFDGANPNGTWSLYVITTAGGDGTGQIAGGWSLNITSASAASTTTSLASSPNPSFTSGTASSVTLTATVTSSSTVSAGTVAFTDAGTTISGCGAQPVSAGLATCTTTFTTEGAHALEAQYSGTASFGASNGSASQQVDDHTTVTGDNYCNTGSIGLNNPPITLADASPYPSHVFVSGLTGTVSDLTVTLKGVTYSQSQDIDALLVGPSGQTLILVADAGPNSSGAISNVTLTLDGAASSTLSASAIWGVPGSNVTSKPVNYGGFNETFGAPAPAGPYGNPGPSGGGTATLGSVFDGAGANGTWSLYLITTAAGDGTGQVSGGWCASISTASAAATTTTLGSSQNPSFTSAPSSSVTLTASVTSSGTPVTAGTVDFTDAGTTISGCGAQAVDPAGQATCTTTFSTEGQHALQASYGGTASYGASSGTLSQEVDNHTTVTATSFCNAGSIALNNPSVTLADASPYPSRVFVSGLPGPLTALTVTLKGVTYSQSQDVDALLVGPGGQSLILVAAAGPNSSGAISNVTLTLDDAAASTLSASAIWGAPSSSVTSKPVNYGGLNETFGAPAPAGPYGNPGPNGGGTATLGSEFDATSANGTWSLYVITTAAGDGTGQIAGGWCLGTTISKAALTLGTTASPSVAVGGQISDAATLSGVPTGDDAPTGSVTFTAYGPDDPTCTTAAYTDTVSLAGAGTSTSSGAFTPTQVGTYRWVASYSGDSNYTAPATGCGAAGESVAVTQATPTIATSASPSAVVGGSIGDSATLDAGHAPTGSIVFDVYGPGDASCATPVFTATVAVSGNGVYSSGSFTPTETGTYRFVASYGGDTDNAAVASVCGDAAESVVVTQASPSLSTNASAGVTVGGQVSDTATLGSGYAPTGSITFDLYGPGDTSCSSPVFTSTKTVSSGDAAYTSDSYTPAHAGTYLWVASYGGDTNNATAATTCGDATESVVVAPASPSISTAPSPGVTVGGQVSDTASLTGGLAPSGSITFVLYGPGDTSCSTPVFTSTKTVSSGDGEYASDSFTTTAPGTYRWVASYGGDGNNNVAATTCGDGSESVVVSQASPSLSSTASPGVALGGSVSDTATLGGGYSPTGSITFVLYGPGDTSCSTPVFTSTKTVSAGDGDYASASFTPTHLGTYRWVASYGGDANNNAAATTCGSESVVVSQASPSLSSTASAGVTVGGSVSDTATLGGGYSPSGSITFVLYGPGDSSCSTPLFTSTKAVAGDGDYTSNSFTPAGAGAYRWVATYGGDGNNASVATTCGDASETVVVAKAAPTVSAQASAGVPAGGQVSDTATLGGGYSPTGSITFDLYGPGDSSCSSAPVFTSTKSVSAGDGNYTSDSFTAALAGTYRWVASYGGDANNAAAATACGDAGASVVVAKAATATTLVSSLDPSLAGQAVTFTAAVAGTAPGGSVTFEDGGSALATQTLGASGVATLTTSSLGTGTHAITAVYAGDANNLPSTSTALVQVVNPAPPPPVAPPTVRVTSPGSGAVYAFGHRVSAAYSCTEGANGPGIASCVAPVANGARIDTTKAGTHVFAVTATSRDGKTATAFVAYIVLAPSNRFSLSHLGTHPGGSVTFDLKLPGPGILDVLETGWKDNFARDAALLQPAARRLVVARKHVVFRRAGTVRVTAPLNRRGRVLLAHHRYPVLTRLWVSYTPVGGTQRSLGTFGLEFRPRGGHA